MAQVLQTRLDEYLLDSPSNSRFSEEKFRFLFVDSILQTAIEPILRKAKDESLHELDFILPKPKQKLENLHEMVQTECICSVILIQAQCGRS